MSIALLAVANPAYTAGVVTGRLLPLVLGIYLLVSGLRRRSDPSTSNRGTGRIVAGAVLMVLFLATLATLSTGTRV